MELSQLKEQLIDICANGVPANYPTCAALLAESLSAIQLLENQAPAMCPINQEQHTDVAKLVNEMRVKAEESHSSANANRLRRRAASIKSLLRGYAASPLADEPWNGTDVLRVGHITNKGRTVAVSTLQVVSDHAGEYVVSNRTGVKPPLDKFDKLATAMAALLMGSPRPTTHDLANTLRDLESASRLVVSGDQS